jgi:hypothetical protein
MKLSRTGAVAGELKVKGGDVSWISVYSKYFKIPSLFATLRMTI